MTTRRPASAAAGPPLTGASMSEAPRSASRAASSSHVDGWIVLCTATMLPAVTDGSIASTTSMTSSSFTTQRQMRSDAAARSAGVAANEAPVSVNASSASGRRAQSVVGCPARAIWRAIGPPCRPMPTKPTRVMALLFTREGSGQASVRSATGVAAVGSPTAARSRRSRCCPPSPWWSPGRGGSANPV